MKSLAWKEWTENRIIILASTLLFIVLFWLVVAFERYTAGPFNTHQIQLVDFEPLVSLYWAIPAALCSTAMFSSEIGSGSIGFLTSLPLSRNKIWFGKSLVAALILVVSMAATAVLFALLIELAESTHIVVSDSIFTSGALTEGVIFGAALTIPVFALGSLSTVLVDQTVKALLLLIVLGIVLLCVVTSIHPQYTDSSAIANVSQIIVLAAAIITSFVMSNRIFVDGETMKTLAKLRVVGWVALDFLAIVLALTISYFWLIY